jgi:hypothetical protein
MRCSQASRFVASMVLALVAVGLASCGSSDPNVHGVSGAVAGLTPGESVRLELNGGNQITVSSLGTFTFPAAVGNNAAYSVTVVGQPQGQVCTVTNGAGAAITNNVTNVQVTCAAQTFTLSGTLTGLAANSRLVLKDNGADPLTLATNGSFSFATPVGFNGTYAVTVGTEPADATCTVQGGTGAGMTANVTSIAVVCSPITFTLRGTLNNLASGLQVTLENNAADPLTLSADGTFTFSTPVADSGAYNVTVGTQPAGQTCSVTNGQATQVSANVANITVTCSTNTYTIGGSVSGLGAGQQVTLEDNGGNALTVTANTSFTFTTPVVYGGAYTVTVGTQPSGLACLVSNGSGSPVIAAVTNLGIDCVPNTVSFTTPGTSTWTVPEGLTTISIVATGGGGGGGGMSGAGAYVGQAGGAGAVVTSTLSVTPGQVLNLVVGGAGGAGAYANANLYFGGGGGGGGSSNVDASTTHQIIAGGGGGGGSYLGGAGGNAGGTGGAGGNGGNSGAFGTTGGGGGSGGTGGAAGSSGFGTGVSGSSGNGGAGGKGGNNTVSIPGGSGGSSAGAGAGASDTMSTFAGGGGGGYGGGGIGFSSTGGGAGGSTGPGGTTYAPASNGGGSATNGGAGSIVVTLQ